MITLKQARHYAAKMHGTQKDKNGRPYIEHLEAVRAGTVIFGADLQVQAAAILHDVIEDTAATYDDLRKLGANERQIAAIKAVTKVKGSVQANYLDGIVAAGPDAMMIKLADLLHNTRPDRLALLPEYTRNRLRRKYAPSIARLMSELGYIVTTEQLAAIPQGSYGSFPSDSYELKDRNTTWLMKSDEIEVTTGVFKVVKDKRKSGKTVTFTFTDGTTLEAHEDAKLKGRMVKKTYTSSTPTTSTTKTTYTPPPPTQSTSTPPWRPAAWAKADAEKEAASVHDLTEEEWEQIMAGL